jgi:hypothetical protein
VFGGGRSTSPRRAAWTGARSSPLFSASIRALSWSARPVSTRPTMRRGRSVPGPGTRPGRCFPRRARAAGCWRASRSPSRGTAHALAAARSPRTAPTFCRCRSTQRTARRIRGSPPREQPRSPASSRPPGSTPLRAATWRSPAQRDHRGGVLRLDLSRPCLTYRGQLSRMLDGLRPRCSA